MLRLSLLAALLCLFGGSARADGLVIDPFTTFPAAGGSYTPQAIDCASSAYVDLGATGLGTSSTGFTFAAAFEVAASPSDGALFYRAGSDRMHFWWNSDGTVEFYIKDNGGNIGWQWQSTVDFQRRHEGGHPTHLLQKHRARGLD